MEQNLDPKLPPDLQLTPVAKKIPIKLITVAVAIAILVAGTGYWFIYSKVSPQTIQNPEPDTTTPVESLNAKISWVSNPPKLATIFSKNNDQTTTSVSAICLPGTECQDTVVSQTDTPNYYACTLDTQCSFFTGFTGVQTGNVGITQSVPAQTNGSAPASTQPPGGGVPTSNPALPTAVSGSEGCFNKQKLLENAHNKNGLKEDTSVMCECGIQSPSNSISGSSSAVDANTGETTPGTMSSVENQAGKSWNCMKAEIRPDIMTENFIFPQSVSASSPFSISFDYKNVGVVACQESYFQVDITRTVTGRSENLGGSGAHIVYNSPLQPGRKDTFTFGNHLLPKFDVVGDYKLNLTMFCKLPRETHIVNGMKEINIKVVPETIVTIPKNILVGIDFNKAAETSADLDTFHTLGMNLYVLPLDWASIEKKPGIYDFQWLDLALSIIKPKGYTLAIILKTVDTNNLLIPEDLKSKKFDDPVFLSRYQAFITAFSNKLEGKVPYVFVGNESDIYFAKHKSEHAAYVKILQSAFSIIKNKKPNVKVGTSVTIEGIEGYADIVTSLNKNTDLFVTTYYPPYSATYDIAGYFKKVTKLASGKPIFIQEVGYPSASLISSEQKQALFFNKFFSELSKVSNLVAVRINTLYDYSKSECDAFAIYYGVSDDSFKAFLCSLGFKKADGSDKAVMNVLKNALKR